jgi:hypothetical protein
VRRDGFGGWSIVLTPPTGSGPKIALQQSETPPDDHPRLHLDLHVPDIDEQASEVERLVSIGAERVDWDSYSDDPDFVVLSDPDGIASASWTSVTRMIDRIGKPDISSPCRPSWNSVNSLPRRAERFPFVSADLLVERGGPVRSQSSERRPVVSRVPRVVREIRQQLVKRAGR